MIRIHLPLISRSIVLVWYLNYPIQSSSALETGFVRLVFGFLVMIHTHYFEDNAHDHQELHHQV